MTIGPVAAELDPELEALPEPRRPFRRTTFATLGATALASVLLSWSLADEARFALTPGPPRELGSLTHVQPGPGDADAWVHGEGPLEDDAIEYRRPLDPDRFRLVRVRGNPHVFVEVRIPGDLDPDEYLPPSSFVGRLVPFDHPGLRHRAVVDGAARLGVHPPAGSWLLVDGEAPATTRWAFGLIGLFVGFAVFSVWGFSRLLRPVGEGPVGAR